MAAISRSRLLGRKCSKECHSHVPSGVTSSATYLRLYLNKNRLNRVIPQENIVVSPKILPKANLLPVAYCPANTIQNMLPDIADGFPQVRAGPNVQSRR